MLQLESRLGHTRGARSRSSKGARLTVSDFAGRTWVTRKGIYVDCKADVERLGRGGAIFDHLYTYFSRS